MTDNLARLAQIKCFLFDMDGTINLGDTLISGMEGFFAALKERGRKYYLVTNNSSRGHAHYAAKMNRLGVPVTEDEILISSDALVSWLDKHQGARSLFVLGTGELKDFLIEKGYKLTDNVNESCDYVVVGFDQTLTYASLTTACRLIDRGVPYVATHPDVRCPVEGGEYIPDTGAMLELIRAATGREVKLIFGKPYRYMVDVVLERTGFKRSEIAMVGDRLSTDIAFGLNNHILSVLVLTGEATMDDVRSGRVRPDIILNHAKEILQYI